MPIHRMKSVAYYTLQRFRIIALCLLIAAAPACAKAGGKDYFPLTAGARWEYAGRIFSPNGQFDVPALARIEGETIIRGRRYFKYVITSDLSAVTKSLWRSEEVRYYRTDRDGIYFLPGKDTSSEEMLEMPLPVGTGTSWLSGTSEVKAETAGTVNVDGREYIDCLKITYIGLGGVKRTEYYLAPNVGVVRAKYADVVGPGSSLELMLVNHKR